MDTSSRCVSEMGEGRGEGGWGVGEEVGGISRRLEGGEEVSRGGKDGGTGREEVVGRRMDEEFCESLNGNQEGERMGIGGLSGGEDGGSPGVRGATRDACIH